MTTSNYSINGLNDLLEDLETLTICLNSMPIEHVDTDAYSRIQDDQLSMIQSITLYGLRLANQQSTLNTGS